MPEYLFGSEHWNRVRCTTTARLWPVLSLCSVTDLMIPSETVFLTTLEGTWDRCGAPPDVWLTTGLLANVETLPENTSRAQEAQREHLYLLLVPVVYPAKLVLLVLQGINCPSVAAAPYIILLAVLQPMMLSPVVLKLIPGSILKEGSDESEHCGCLRLDSHLDQGGEWAGEEWITDRFIVDRSSNSTLHESVFLSVVSRLNNKTAAPQTGFCSYGGLWTYFEFPRLLLKSTVSTEDGILSGEMFELPALIILG
ncbi:hypothetical protein DFH07DRAFT_767297 [Mycena maculata]|uniref:Uncharacterized protein n=1 Tax=Mycena maculata TaxID=230809 RepID=A0AAD7JYP3_9AGAR|nr:hypothetical protein DFH07DRAFT_767297 [Mycena maculata]